MKISNINIRNMIRWAVGALIFVVITDIIMVVFFPEFMDRFFTGYTAVAVPLLIISVYAFIGFPIFSFNDSTNILHIKSHLAMGEFFGKELKVHKKNIVKLSVDQDRLRKTLRVYYLEAGEEHVETFSITLLSNQKLRKLAREVELIETQVGNKGGQHLFI
jgi:hypothetical protein